MLILMIVVAGRKWLMAKGLIKARVLLPAKQCGLMDGGVGY